MSESLDEGENSVLGEADPLADWTMFGDFVGKSVLDLGDDSMSIPLASVARCVASVGSKPSECAGLLCTARERGLRNVSVFCADIRQLPVAVSSVERVVMVGGLGRIGRGSGSESGRAAQTRFLVALRQRLTADGEVWVITENLFSPRRLTSGRSDPVLPSGTAHAGWWGALVSCVGRRRWDPALSERGYRRLFLEAGLDDFEVYYGFGDRHNMRFVSSTARRGVIRNYVESVRQGGSPRARVGLAVIRLADRLGLAGAVCPTLIFRASTSCKC